MDCICTHCTRAPEVVPRLVPTYPPHRRVTVAQRWTERPGSPAVLDRGPTTWLLLTHCLSGTRWKLVAWPGQFFFGESGPGLQAPSSGIALGSDRQVDDGQTDSQLWVGSWLHVSCLTQLVGASPCLCAELPCHVPCVNARAPAAPTAGKLAFIEALTSALCSCGRRLGGREEQAWAGHCHGAPMRPGVLSLPNWRFPTPRHAKSRPCRSLGALVGSTWGRGSELRLAPGTRE